MNASYPEQPNLQPYRRGSNWLSTGVYAPPGAVLTVTVPSTVTLDGSLWAQIGVHSESLLNKASWCRQPYQMVKTVAFTSNRTVKIASNQGGPVIIGVKRLAVFGPIEVSISGSVRMPFYFRGTHNNSYWQTTGRNLQAPFAEFASDKFVLTVPASNVRAISNAQALVDMYESYLDVYTDLAVVRSEVVLRFPRLGP